MKNTLAVLSKLATQLSSHCKISLLATLLCVTISALRANQCVAATALEPEKNLVSTHYFQPAVSYLPTERAWNRWAGTNFTVQNEELIIPKTPDGKTNRALMPLSWSTILAEHLEISFDYSLQGKGAMTSCGKSFPLQSGIGQKFKVKLPVDLLSGNGSLTFSCSGDDGRLTVKNVVVKAIRPKGGLGKALLADGVKIDSIYFAETNTKHTFLDQRGANLMQKNLYLAGAGVLPIKVLPKGQRPANGIIIGQAAKEYISSESLKQVGEGGYALKVNKGIAAVYGDDSYANSGGVLALMKKIGFLYLTSSEYIEPAGDELNLGRFEENLTPAIAWRLGDHRGDPIAEGMSDPVCLSDYRVLGTYRGFGHSFPFIIGWDEFKDSDPEFFAMQEDGVRRKSERGDLHYCFSNEKLQQLAVERIREFLDADPIGKMFFLGPGDGMHLYCRCEKCKTLGTPTDARLYFSNRIAEQLQESHPDVILCISAYTDTAPAPQKHKPAPNVLVKYCPYEPYWMNHLQTDHRDNAPGWKQLREWMDICPENMVAFVYPTSCQERLNVWPAFYANYEKYKYFGRHKFRQLTFCGLRSWEKTLPGSGIFNPAHRYIMIKVLWNPEVNFEQEIDDFFKLYYGKAAPALRKIFDLLHQEVVKRDWSQNTEKVIRGFMTQELADKCLDLHDQALREVDNQQPYFDRVERERLYILWSYLSDINRANGKLKPADFTKFAKSLGEFCRLGEKYSILNIGRLTLEKWFWDSAMIKIPSSGRWYDAPVIQKLIADPDGTLGAEVPRVQVRTDYGYSIPALGMFGGRAVDSSWLRVSSAPVKQLYRPSSGFGMTRMLLTLDKMPMKPVIIKTNGIDNEKAEPATMRLLVNGEQVYEGKVPWQKDAWSWQDFTVPASFWTVGENEIQFLNTTPDGEVFSQGRPVAQNYHWGWYTIDECQFLVK